MSAGDDRDEGFLSRWSRRKREATRPEEAAPEHAAVPPATEAAPQPQAPAEPAPPEPEMIEPPSLDLVDKDFDIAHWLKQNVPQSWKLAALRRAWETDPAISGYLDPARDYALDWNTPGGAPGYGPLTESDDVEAMIRQIFGESADSQPEQPPETPAAAPGDSMPHQPVEGETSSDPDVAEQQTEPPPARGSAVRLSDDPAATADFSGRMSASPAPMRVAVQKEEAAPAQPARIRKRGGGAIPI